MSLRRLIVQVDTSTINVTEFCRVHGVSTWFFYDLRRRHTVEGDTVLEPKSRAPLSVPNKTPPDIEDLIVSTRKELADAGLDAGPQTIRFHLEGIDRVPSVATIWRILKARGFVQAEPAKAPKGAGRRFNASRANESWQIDDTCWELKDSVPVKILDVIDDHSRLAVAITAMETCTGEASLVVLAKAAVELGWPARVQSDNAQAFKAVLSQALDPLGVNSVQSRIYHPQTNGKVERFHQTLKKWLKKQAPAATLAVLQTQLDEFKVIYNTKRKHTAVNGFPATVWADAPKDGPATHPIGTIQTRTYLNQVRAGRVSTGKKTRVTVGSQYNGQTALLIITGTTLQAFIAGKHIRTIHNFDPQRHTYRLRKHPTR